MSDTSLNSSKKRRSSTSHAEPSAKVPFLWPMVLSFLKSVRQFLATRAAVVCIPYASVPGMDINSSAYLKASRTLAKSSETSTTKPTSSCAPCSTSAFHEYKSCLPSSKVIFLFSDLLFL